MSKQQKHVIDTKYYIFVLLIALVQASSTRAYDFQIESRIPARNRLKLKVAHSQNVEIVFRGGASNYNDDSYKDDLYNDDPYYQDQYYQEQYYSDKKDINEYYDDDRSIGDRVSFLLCLDILWILSRMYVSDGLKSDYSGRDLPRIFKNGDKRIGFALLGSGAVFTMLGVSLFFNKSLMRLGNLLFIAGVPITIGPGRTAGYFFQPKKSRATACLALGIFLVFIGSPVFGILLEIFGLLNLFGNMFPLLKMMIKTLPGVGSLLGDGGKGNRRDYDNRDSYEDNQGYYDDYGQENSDQYYRDRDNNRNY